MKRATNTFAGRSYSSTGVPFCSMRPLFMRITRSAIDIASTWSCVTYTIVMPSLRCSARISWRISARSCASRFDSGSSIRHTGASLMIARPSATRCCWPPESCDGLRASNADRPSSSATRASRASHSCRRNAPHAQAEQDVLRDGQMREQRVALEHHRDVALGRRQPRDVAVGDHDAAAVGRLESGDQAQRGRLAAARWAEQHVERARRERERDAVDGAHLAVGGRPVLADVLDGDGRHADVLQAYPNSAVSAAPGIGRAHERLADQERMDAARSASSSRRAAWRCRSR